MRGVSTALLLGLLAAAAAATELHVSPRGSDAAPGTARRPLRTIQRAADLARPGDTVTVHAGIYRERVDPPRGGASDTARIVYRAAPGEQVEIRGSEIATGWVHDRGDVWRLTLPNAFFGSFNPYADPIRGDWFDPRGREHHTGAVYLDGEWLTEAASLDELYLPDGAKPEWMTAEPGHCLLNVAWFEIDGRSTPAVRFAEQQGIQTAPCVEGGECIGWIEHGDWVLYKGLDFGAGTDTIDLRVASATEGGRIEIRLDSPQGELLGETVVPSTADWQVWVSVSAEIRRLSGVHDVCLSFRNLLSRDEQIRARGLNPSLWFAEVDAGETTIRAQFPGVDPNRGRVEINVRRTVFYPSEPGRNYITVRGFTMCHAATPWAPPTAEQIGLIGTHWSKGWVIEDNTISHSVCSGIALGKHGDEFDNTSANTAEGYVATIERAHAFSIPWDQEHIGGHVVRNNTISHCEQAGIVGSMGAAFSTVEDNVIHEIHMRRLFSGAEMAGIKFHGAIDTEIRRNHIYRTCLGLWLDWMAQGTRVHANLFHDNGTDLFVEVNHGPFVVDNNLFLSGANLLDVSQGGAYVHNLFAGVLSGFPDLGRETPYHPAHSTAVAGLARTGGGDDRFVNNLFVGPGSGLRLYDDRPVPLLTAGNVYLAGAEPYSAEVAPIVDAEADPAIDLQDDGVAYFVRLIPPSALRTARAARVTGAALGTTHVAQLPYETRDGSELVFDTDCLGEQRTGERVLPGPFATLGPGASRIRVR